MNKISTYIQHMASCRDINDCTDVPWRVSTLNIKL